MDKFWLWGWRRCGPFQGSCGVGVVVGILDYSGKVYLQMTEQQDAKRPQSLGTLQRRAAIADRLSEGRNRYS